MLKEKNYLLIKLMNDEIIGKLDSEVSVWRIKNTNSEPERKVIISKKLSSKAT